MISIIVSSYNNNNFSKFEENISKTIGVDFEIIRIENHNEYSIAEAYNRGAMKANNEFLVFCHEDVLFHTDNWGAVVIDAFNRNTKLGLCGFAGSVLKTYEPSGWFTRLRQNRKCYFIQGSNDRAFHENVFLVDENTKVACLDGFCLITKKEIFLENQFDENIITGFHGYDIDLSLSIGQNFDLEVLFGIDVEHFSHGNMDGNYYDAIININRKWMHILPKIITDVDSKTHKYEEYRSLRSMIGIARINKCNIKKLDIYIFNKKTIKLLGWKNYLIVLSYYIIVYVYIHLIMSK